MVYGDALHDKEKNDASRSQERKLALSEDFITVMENNADGSGVIQNEMAEYMKKNSEILTRSISASSISSITDGGNSTDMTDLSTNENIERELEVSGDSIADSKNSLDVGGNWDVMRDFTNSNQENATGFNSPNYSFHVPDTQKYANKWDAIMNYKKTETDQQGDNGMLSEATLASSSFESTAADNQNAAGFADGSQKTPTASENTDAPEPDYDNDELEEEGYDEREKPCREWMSPLKFRKELLQETTELHDSKKEDNLPHLHLSENLFTGREDLQDLLTCTIDCEETMDMDDAISLEKTEDGCYVYVHIADVAALVVPGSPHDIIAQERGTSVYLGEKVFHMFGYKATSTMSLKPNEVRLAITMKVFIQENGELDKDKRPPKLFRSIIKSNAKLCYKMVDKVLRQEQVEQLPVLYNCTWEELRNMLLLLDRCCDAAEAAHDNKSERVHFHTPDVKYKFGLGGEVLDIQVVEFSRSFDLVSYLNILYNLMAGYALRRKLNEENKVPFTPLFTKQEHKKAYKQDSYSNSFEEHGQLFSVGENAATAMKFLKEIEQPEMNQYVTVMLNGTFKGSRVMILEEREHDGEISETKNDFQGTNSYAQTSSPIRKYVNLMVQRQLLYAIGAEDVAQSLDLPRLLKSYISRLKDAKRVERSFNDAAFAEYHKEDLEVVVVDPDRNWTEVAVLSQGRKHRLDKVNKFLSTGDVVDVTISWKNNDLQFEAFGGRKRGVRQGKSCNLVLSSDPVEGSGC